MIFKNTLFLTLLLSASAQDYLEDPYFEDWGTARRILQGETEPTVKPDVPTMCDDLNQGRCDCNVNEGFTTYTYWASNKQRCFTVYIPLETTTPKPVMLHLNCYAGDRLNGLQMKNRNTDLIKAADRWDFITVGLSVSKDTGRKNWNFPSVGTENKCDDSESTDLAYARTVLDFLETDPSMQGLVDLGRIYTEGFSQNAMFSGFIGYCLRDRLAVAIQGGGGLHMVDEQGKIKRKGSYRSCEGCDTWPMTLGAEDTDFVICNLIYEGDGYWKSADNMREFMTRNALDVRYMKFPNGRHNWAKNSHDWWVGCSGMYEACSAECAVSFSGCVDSEAANNPDEASDVHFKSCMDPDAMETLNGCTRMCAPTLDMLRRSEEPSQIVLGHEKFGTTDFSEPDPTTDAPACDVEALRVEVSGVKQAIADTSRWKNRCDPDYNAELKVWWSTQENLSSGLCSEEEMIEVSPSRWFGRVLIPELAACLQ